MVSTDKILVHNGCIDDYLEFYSSAKDLKELKALGIPNAPSIFKSTGDWGKHIGWGKGDADALAKIGNITKGDLNGLTKELAGQWHAYYANVKRLTPDNPSAGGRANLMKYIYDNFETLIK